MAIEFHIQIDLLREPIQIAAKLNREETTLLEVNCLIAELERLKTELFNIEFDENGTDI